MCNKKRFSLGLAGQLLYTVDNTEDITIMMGRFDFQCGSLALQS